MIAGSGTAERLHDDDRSKLPERTQSTGGLTPNDVSRVSLPGTLSQRPDAIQVSQQGSKDG